MIGGTLNPFYAFVEQWKCPRCGTERRIKRRRESVGKRVQSWCQECQSFRVSLVGTEEDAAVLMKKYTLEEIADALEQVPHRTTWILVLATQIRGIASRTPCVRRMVGLLDKLVEDRKAAEPTLRSACEAVLLFYSGANWGTAERARWKALTGSDDATTKVLADAVRLALR